MASLSGLAMAFSFFFLFHSHCSACTTAQETLELRSFDGHHPLNTIRVKNSVAFLSTAAEIRETVRCGQNLIGRNQLSRRRNASRRTAGKRSS
jgi:hypothetical protein